MQFSNGILACHRCQVYGLSVPADRFSTRFIAEIWHSLLKKVHLKRVAYTQNRDDIGVSKEAFGSYLNLNCTKIRKMYFRLPHLNAITFPINFREYHQSIWINRWPFRRVRILNFPTRIILNLYYQSAVLHQFSRQ